MLPSSLQEGWTPGAQRALARAARLANLQAASEVEPTHLLGALLLDDGRAGATLATSGLTLSHLFAESLEAELLDATVVPHPWGEAVLSVLVEARQFAAAGGEAGTNHLLRGLAQVASSVSPHLEFLQAFGDTDLPRTSLEPSLPPEPVPEELRLAEREPIEVNQMELLRILDAAANRAREGLRVVEDYTRFGWNDRHLSEQLKQCRHEIAAAMSVIPGFELLSARDTPKDVGTRIATLDEYRRTELADVLTAAFKRAEEALRTLEEYGKVVSGLLGREMEQLRYRVYTLEKAVLRTESNRQRLAEQQLYVLVTESLCHHGSGPAILGAIAAGVRMFQVREKTMKDRDLIEQARHARRWTRAADALLIINDRPDVAALVDADGVHVGQDELTVADVRKIIGPTKLVGVSTHSIEQARQAVLDGADYLGVGPTFPSGTKSFVEFPGLDLVRQVAGEIALPWFAIGGITADNIGAVRHAGATRVAVSGAVCGAENPAEAATQLF